jgi:hypothetical protein
LSEGMCGGIFFVDSEEEMMKTRSCLKIFGSLNYFVELFKVQSSPNPLVVAGCYTSKYCESKIHSISYLKPKSRTES